MISHRGVACGVLAASLVAAAPAHAGWVIDQVARDGGAGSRMQVLLQAYRMKSVTLEPDGRPAMAFIVDLDRETITQVDYTQHRYTTATIQEYAEAMGRARQAAAGQMAGAMEHMQEAMKNLPPNSARWQSR